MKKLAVALLLISLVACNKKSSQLRKINYRNTVTILVDKKKYIDSGGCILLGPGVTCGITKNGTNSSLSLVTTYGSDNEPYEVQINLNNLTNGPASGVGTYSGASEAQYDNSGNLIGYNFQGSVTENSNGIRYYNIDSTTLEVTDISGNYVKGTFRLHITNTATSKVVTGSFDCPDATITH